MGFTTQQDVERKTISILKVLNDSSVPIGSRVIAARLAEMGIDLGERAVRYHLKLLDENGQTRLAGRRDGRLLTQRGQEELENALVQDKVGFAISKIETLAFRTDFNIDTQTGSVPINISFFFKDIFPQSLEAMKPAFKAGFCISNLVAVADEGQQLGGVSVPMGMVGFATVCSVVLNGVLLKKGVPMESRFSGVLQLRDYKPMRFVELINYSGCSLDASEVFIRANMTRVINAVEEGNGKILATYREIPAVCKPVVDQTVAKLEQIGMSGLVLMGGVSETVCEIPVELNRVGIIYLNGLNPVAAAAEAGFEAENHGMSTVIPYSSLMDINSITA
ncbi:DUF128 domain-containing protein [Chloroflexota bacterium]